MKTKLYSLTPIIFMVMLIMLSPNVGFAQMTSTTQSNNAEFIKGSIVIKVKEGIGPFEMQKTNISFGNSSLDEKASKFNVTMLEKRFKHKPIPKNSGLPDLSRIYRIEFPESQNVHQVAREFASDPNIEYAEAIPIHILDDIPDDASYSQCQHLFQIMAEDAWNIHKGEEGTEEIIIAIVDSGIDWDHEDLQSNVWQNMAEDADGDGVTMVFQSGEWILDPGDINGIDDDNNGYIDDLIGWNFIQNGNDPNPIIGNPLGYHGTHCAGISNGATNNSTGIASISWNLSVMGICVDENNSVVFGYDGIIYAAENGADIISNSWSGLASSQANQEVINYAQQLGSIVIASTGNHNSLQLHYPASYPGVLSVASVSEDDTKAGYSAYGPAVDISAPGGGNEGGILSTMPDNNYGLMSGTSMACPLVAGCFGLLKSYHPAWTNEQLITQILGTADDINTINPNYENLLGTGRVNAFHFLDDDSVTMPQILKLDFKSMSYEDANGNQVNEPGEEVTLNFEFRNYVPFVGDDEAIATLSSDDPDITILSESATVVIPPDGFFTIEDQFQFLVSEEATPHMAVFTVSFESEVEITWGQEYTVEVLVAPDGVFIFEGEENGKGYSGTYIKEILDQLGIQYIYSNTYPPTLHGFETVFVSHSNIGQDQVQSIGFSEEQSLMFQEFLENGGNMFVDMGNMFTLLDYFNYSNAVEIKSLFGVQSNTIHFASNPINYLNGMSGSVMEDIHFTQSNQPHSWYVDDLEVTSNAVATFTESDYGIVSVMNDGVPSYGHKTFYMAYSLAELIDIDAINSKNNVLLKVLDFFELLPDGYVVANFSADQTEGKPDLEVQFTDFSLVDEGYEITGWAWDFNEDGEFDSYDQNPVWTYSDGGVFDVKLVVFGDEDIDTLVRKDCITVRSGILVYEGKPNENGYSGTFIRDYLEDHWYDEVGYTNSFPQKLDGYNAVFLSFGNTGLRGSPLNSQMANAIYNFGLSGGSIYLEGGDAVSSDAIIWLVTGIKDVDDGDINMIDGLMGIEGAITDGMQFNSTNQLSYKSIDSYTIYDDMPEAKIAFEESDYGPVAVQFDGINMFGQKTFCMSYALADLEDGDGINTRKELLERILEFLDVTVGIAEQAIDDLNTVLKLFPNPASDQITLEFSIEQASTVIIKIFDLSGRKISESSNKFSKGTNRIDYDVNDYSQGIYYFRLQAGEQHGQGKMVLMK